MPKCHPEPKCEGPSPEGELHSPREHTCTSIDTCTHNFDASPSPENAETGKKRECASSEVTGTPGAYTNLVSALV